LITFSGKPIGSDEFLNRIVEALGIIIDRRPKGRLHKRGSLTIEKIGVPIFQWDIDQLMASSIKQF
jgi:hypothetical protein